MLYFMYYQMMMEEEKIRARKAKDFKIELSDYKVNSKLRI
jgi:hypothetical protein